MKKLILTDGKEQHEINLPPEILEALWRNDTQIVAEYIGWSTRWGMLGSTTETKSIMAEDPEKPWRDSAGFLSITLTNKVKATESQCDFLPYMSHKERKEKGYCK